MDVDEDVYDFLPYVLRSCMVYHCRVYTNAKSCSDFILTGGHDPVLYEIKGKNILSSFHLHDTIFRDKVIPKSVPSLNSLNISFKAYYSYKKKIKEQFLFLRIDNSLAVFGRIDQKLTVHREFIDISNYEITDKKCTGEPSVEIIYHNGPPEEFELVSLSYLSKGIDLRLLMEGEHHFQKITQELEERVAQASSALADMKVEIQERSDTLQTYQQTVDQNSNEDINIVSRYGDFWVRNVNGRILIAIPIYNSSSNEDYIDYCTFYLKRYKLKY